MQAGIRFWPFQAKRPGLVSPGPASTSIKKRAIGFEPTTSSLGSWHSTTELRPQADFTPLSRVTANRQDRFDPSRYALSRFRSVSSRRNREETARFLSRRAALMLARLFVGQSPEDAEPTDGVATEAMAGSESEGAP